MSDPYAGIAERLTNAGFREAEPGCFTSSASPRVIGLALCGPDVDTWGHEVEELLRRQTMRITMAWARYVILLVDADKASPLAWAAASFAQDVSKCRRIVVFVGGATDSVTLPFIGLPSFTDRADAPPRDIETVVKNLLSTKLADAFLDDALTTTRVQTLAEEEET